MRFIGFRLRPFKRCYNLSCFELVYWVLVGDLNRVAVEVDAFEGDEEEGVGGLPLGFFESGESGLFVGFEPLNGGKGGTGGSDFHDSLHSFAFFFGDKGEPFAVGADG